MEKVIVEKEEISDRQYKNYILMLCKCIRTNIDTVMGKKKAKEEEFNDSVKFLFGDGIDNFIEKYELPFNSRLMKKLIFSHMVDYNYDNKRKKFMDKGSRSIFEECLTDDFEYVKNIKDANKVGSNKIKSNKINSNKIKSNKEETCLE